MFPLHVLEKDELVREAVSALQATRSHRTTVLLRDVLLVLTIVSDAVVAGTTLQKLNILNQTCGTLHVTYTTATLHSK